MRLLALLALAAIALVAWTLEAAATDGQIHSCIRKNGTVEIVSDPSECSKTETPLSWNQVGPQGPEGPAGPEGQEGGMGEPGTLS